MLPQPPADAVYLRDPDAARGDAADDLRWAQQSVKAACDRLVQARSQEDADLERELAALDEAGRWLAAAVRRTAEVGHARARLARLAAGS